MEQELNRKQSLAQLVTALDRVYPGGNFDAEAYRTDQGGANFVTTRLGNERILTSKASSALAALTYAWQKEIAQPEVKVEAKQLQRVLLQAVVDLHDEGLFSGDESENLKKLNHAIEQEFSKATSTFTHSFPARTLNMEVAGPFGIGPVTIYTRDQWLDEVDFPERAKREFGQNPVANEKWKELLREDLENPRREYSPEDDESRGGLACIMYSPLSKARSLVRVTLSGYECGLSHKAARNICKTALDGISLLLGGEAMFHRQTLADERMPPVDHHTIVESNGYLHVPGMGLNQQINPYGGKKIRNDLDQENMKPLREALGHILEGLVSPKTHPHPLLAMRWATALDWLAEGERESSEAIALAKIGTSLDVLASGGKFVGILDMLTHLTDRSKDFAFTVGPNQRTLSWLVKELYDSGRSKILHGSIFDRLQTFSEVRPAASYLARVALIKTLLRFPHYTGDDTAKAFRTMPKAP